MSQDKIKTTIEFCPADRYKYDFDICSGKNGFAQVDTKNDASYYGTWANPTKFVIFSYVEGDCYTTECKDLEVFVLEMYRLKQSQGADFLGIDPGFDKDLKQKFIDAGLSSMLH